MTLVRLIMAFVAILGTTVLGGCQVGPFGAAGGACKDVMEKDGTMFRICETLSNVTVELLGPATAEQLRERYHLRQEGRVVGLSVLLQSPRRRRDSIN
jgi:hypothetical protein